MQTKEIRFIDSYYNELFRIPDGGWVKLEYPDGRTLYRPCKHLDDCHLEMGGNVFHICEFAELMEKNGTTYSPADQLEVVRGYTVTDRTVAGERVYAVAHNPDAAEPYVSWRGRADQKGYFWGNYFKTRSEAQNDCTRRIYEDTETGKLAKTKKEQER